MSKKRELLNFQWQKNQNEFIFSVTLLLALFAVRNEFEGGYKLIVFLIFPLLIFLAGYGLIKLSLSENEYNKELQDKRIRLGLWSKIRSIILILLSFVIGAGIVYVSMNLWKEFFLATFG